MNLQPIWQALKDPAWVVAGLTAVGLLVTGTNYLIIKPIRNWLARRQAEREVVCNLSRFLENPCVLYSAYAEEHISGVINTVHQKRNSWARI